MAMNMETRAMNGERESDDSDEQTAPQMLEGLPLRVPKEILCGQSSASLLDPHAHTTLPLAHITPVSGWASDPHGPIFWKGRYHIFHQARPGTCQWFWGMRWEHLVSNDLITWARLPPALLPTPGWLDADGCFTGNIQVHPGTGVPMLFYTGARLRHKPSALCPEPPVNARNELMLHWETQLCAVADPDDELLVKWTKVDTPWMELPPCAWLTSWRDPFFVPPELSPDTGRPAHIPAKATQSLTSNTAHTQPSRADKTQREHMLLIGSGLEGVGGTALIYRSKDLAAGWEFSGYLATWPNLDTGVCWECPHLLCLPDLPSHVICLSGHTTQPVGASAESDAALRQAVDTVWESLGCRPTHFHRCAPLRTNRPHQPTDATNGYSSNGTDTHTEPLVTRTPPLTPRGPAAPGTVLDVLQTLTLTPPSPLVSLSSPRASTVSTLLTIPQMDSVSIPALEVPRTPAGHSAAAGSASFHAALSVSRQASGASELREDAEQSLAERLLNEAIVRTRVAQEAASSTLQTCMEGEELDPSRLISTCVPATPEPCSEAQSALIQSIQRGRQEAVAALVAEDVSSPTVPPLKSPETLDASPALCDVKTVQEASLGGLGYVGVLSSVTPHDAANQGGDARAGAVVSPSQPVPPFFALGSNVSREERHAACRAYALASAAVQGLDLNMPREDSDVVKRCKVGPTGLPSRARPDQRWLLGMAPDAATYGVLYFIGKYEDNRFDLEDSVGPYKLDLGNVLYAPVAYYDELNGRHIVWGYLKELTVLPAPPSMSNKYTSSGCVSLPRVLYLKDGLLHQVPLPEMCKLRVGTGWHLESGTQLSPDAPVTVPPETAVQQTADMELVVRRGSAASVTLTFNSWRPYNEGALALRYTFETGRLDVLYLTPTAAERHPTDLHLITKDEGEYSIVTEPDGAVYEAFIDPKVPPVPDMNPDVPDWIRMRPGDAGGFLHDGDVLKLRVFLDGSALEVFTGCGQTLSTRVYRGWAKPQAGSKVSLSAHGGAAVIDRLSVYQMKPAWLSEDRDSPLQPPVTREGLVKWLNSFA